MCAVFVVAAGSPTARAAEAGPIGGPAFGRDFDVIVALGLETNGVFRGVKSRKLNPSVYGLLEVTSEAFYGGAYTNAVHIAGETSPLLLGYAGYKPEALGLTFDVGARYYAFVSSEDIAFDDDKDGAFDRFGRKGVFETKLGARKETQWGRITSSFYYTPSTVGETGSAYYVTTELRRKLWSDFELRTDFGYSWHGDSNYHDDYADFGVGVFKSALGFDMFLRYSDTFGLSGSDDRIVVFGIERSLGIISRAGMRTRLFEKIRNDIELNKNSIRIGR